MKKESSLKMRDCSQRDPSRRDKHDAKNTKDDQTVFRLEDIDQDISDHNKLQYHPGHGIQRRLVLDGMIDKIDDDDECGDKREKKGKIAYLLHGFPLLDSTKKGINI
jgi:hypothetical protein